MLAPVVLALAATAAPELRLDRWDFEAGPTTDIRLPAELREVSGLALSPDGRLFAHDDEIAEIHQLDPATGDVLASFGLGESTVTGDFEGLAWADDRLFLITSEGTIAEFRPGANAARVDYRRHVTGLASVCEVEGLTHDPGTGSLLIVCKEMYDDGPPGVYAFDLAQRRLESQPRLAIRSTSGDEVSPSALVIDPGSGNLIVLAARQRRILEVDREGRTVAEARLRRNAHPQAEGIELLPDGTLLIADEGGNGRGRLAWYRPVSPTR